jgi:bisphosphoglycerate-independent phosphoglycerate mutase (AlkP superfamily)
MRVLMCRHWCVQTRFVGMMQYDGDLKLPARFLVPPPAISGVSGELLAKGGVSTFACSETQKFGHVRLHTTPPQIMQINHR